VAIWTRARASSTSLSSALVLTFGLTACAGSPPPGPEVIKGVPASKARPPAAGARPEPRPEPQPAPTPAFAPELIEASRQLTAAAEGDTTGWDRLAYMTDTFGHRLSGSDGLEETIDWAIETMKADGLDEPRREKVMVPRWVRGEESARLVAPYERELVMIGLGNSVGTRGRPLAGEVVLAPDLEGIDALGESAKGKIVLVTKQMPSYDLERHESGYGDAVQPRLHAAARAAKLGAKAVLIHSVTNYGFRTPHTGTTIYEDGIKKIPAAALSLEDAAHIERQIERGVKVKLELRMDAKMLPERESANAVAELRGRELPDEIVVIGCHIDAWDVGDGAHDDGAGCMMAMEAARVLKAANLIPRRTIRVVLFTNEENGGAGGKAYFEAHGEEKHVAAIEADSGSFEPRGFAIGRTEEQLASVAKYAPLFANLGADEFTPNGGGADIRHLQAQGVLGIAVRPEGSHYFDLHHTEADTVDKVNPVHLQRNAMAMALMAYILAERE